MCVFQLYPSSLFYVSLKVFYFSMGAAMSGGQAIGDTLSDGVQEISALLPLLVTEQCEDHVSSALTRGFLYAAAAPLSIFGSLGLARAGFKAFMAAIFIHWRRIQGAKGLADAGFKPQGINLSLIMFDKERKRLLVEKRLDEMV